MLLSAACFGTLAIFTKFAYRAGLDAAQIATFRFLVGGLGMVVVTAIARQNPFRMRARTIVGMVLMGAIGYVAQSYTFILALRSLPASLTELLAYTYPGLVVLGAWLVLRRRPAGVQVIALLGTFAGVVLLVGGIRLAGGPALLYALINPVVYATYLLVGERVMRGAPPIAATTLIIVSAALSMLLLGGATGSLKVPLAGSQWLLIAAMGIITAMVAITALMAALPRVGAARASLLSTVEPVWTVALAVVLLGDRLGPAQVAGAGLVLASVVFLQLRGAPPPPPVPPRASSPPSSG